MKNLLLIIFLTFSCQFCFAQRWRDKLKHELAVAKEDTNKASILLKLSEFYRGKNSDTSLFYGQKALDLSRQIKYSFGESRSLTSLGFTYDGIGNHTKALGFYLKALKIADKNNIADAKAHALERIAFSYFYIKNYAQVLNYNQQAKQLFDTLHNEVMSVIQLHNRCKFYIEMNQLDSALYYAKLVNAYVPKYRFLRSFNNFGRIYAKKGETELALKFTKEALFHSEKGKENSSIALHSGLIAQLYKPLNQDSCIYYAKKSLEYGKKR